MKVKTPAEIIKALRCDFIRTWEYDPPFITLAEELEYRIQQLHDRALYLAREWERTTDPGRKQLYSDMVKELDKKMDVYFEAYSLVLKGRYE